MENTLESHADVRILIAHEDPNVHQLLSHDLKAAHLSIISAHSVTEASSILKVEPVKLLITAVNISNLNAVTLLREAKELNRNLPTILLASNSKEISLEEAFKEQVEALFVAPLNPKLITALAKSAVVSFLEREKRLVIRQAIDLPIEFSFSAGKNSIRGRVKNLGLKGAFISETTEFPKVNDSISFKIFHQTDKSAFVQGKGVVKWTQLIPRGGAEPGFGVEFFFSDKATEIQMLKFVNFIRTNQMSS